MRTCRNESQTEYRPRETRVLCRDLLVIAQSLVEYGGVAALGEMLDRLAYELRNASDSSWFLPGVAVLVLVFYVAFKPRVH